MVRVCAWRRAGGRGLMCVGINARQVVPHVHYHIIPRPDGREREAMEREEGEERRGFRSQFGCGWRAELDDEVGGVLAERVREEIKREVVRAGEEDGRVLGKL